MITALIIIGSLIGVALVLWIWDKCEQEAKRTRTAEARRQEARLMAAASEEESTNTASEPPEGPLRHRTMRKTVVVSSTDPELLDAFEQHPVSIILWPGSSLVGIDYSRKRRFIPRHRREAAEPITSDMLRTSIGTLDKRFRDSATKVAKKNHQVH